ncbi:cytochrome P450, partial [Aureobasidium melanogenum]|uniref:Cytochrome P450 n=1 Tax=Aureobasidium melanogenum (strain CBS 110374) TaxID=1043003 RepID=A0A074VEF0_AURM1
MALSEVLQGLGTSQTLLTVVSLALGILAAYLYFNRALPEGAPPLIKGDWPLIGPIKFWTRRWDFFKEAAKISANGNFSFHVGNHVVVGVSGDEGRRSFIDNKHLDATTGYSTLFAGSPTVPKAIDSDQDDVDDQHFFRRLLAMLKKENFVQNLDSLIADTRSRLEDLVKDPSGMTDPFESIYGVVYQLTMRTVACNEIANDRDLLDKTLDMFEKIEASSSAKLIILPWFPFPGKLKRLWYGARLYMIFKNIIEDRAKNGRRENDPLQFMIEKGDSVKEILTFILGALYAGQLNSGINAAWVIIYLANDPYWRGKVFEEVKAMAERYDSDTSKSLPERLASAPLEAWETELPSIDLCLRDSIRLNLVGSMFRQNLSKSPVKVSDSEEIPAGAFAAYAIANVHLNPEIYAEPEKWDPSRYLPDRAEDQKTKFAYLGWGAGRHPCLGIRFAKLEQNIILAFFLAYFDFDKLVDEHGKQIAEQPRGDMNSHSAAKPKQKIYVKYSVRG